jgi:DNA-binding transcriptional LysR family regulator
MVVIAVKNHPLANAGTISYARLSRELGSSSRTFFENHLALKLETSEMVLSLNAFEAIISCVRNNLGITFISRRLFQ